MKSELTYLSAFFAFCYKLEYIIYRRTIELRIRGQIDNCNDQCHTNNIISVGLTIAIIVYAYIYVLIIVKIGNSQCQLAIKKLS